jgi:hypothetical protein
LFDVILQGTDLSPVTDKLWKKFFEKQFGVDRTNEVIEIMSEKRVSFRWLQLYEVFCLLVLFLLFRLSYVLELIEVLITCNCSFFHTRYYTM